MHENRRETGSAGVVDYWIREAFENQKSRTYGAVSNFVMVVIFYSIATIVLESLAGWEEAHERFFRISEIIVVSIFLIEYVGNIYVTQPRRSYIFGWWGMIDVLAIVPSLINFIDLQQLKVARILRVLRFLRLMRILKLAKRVAADVESIKEQKYGTLKMDLQIYLIAMFSILIISSTLVFYAEGTQKGTLFTDIPTTMWWAIVTMTTVGYGDMSPVTFWGRMVAAITSLCGLAMFAMLMNVMGKAMIQGLFGSPDEAMEDDEDDEDEGTQLGASFGVAPSIPDQIEQLARLREREIITTPQFEDKRDELLARM
jgi:voltage-gated potassium channel